MSEEDILEIQKQATIYIACIGEISQHIRSFITDSSGGEPDTSDAVIYVSNMLVECDNAYTQGLSEALTREIVKKIFETFPNISTDIDGVIRTIKMRSQQRDNA